MARRMPPCHTARLGGKEERPMKLGRHGDTMLIGALQREALELLAEALL